MDTAHEAPPPKGALSPSYEITQEEAHKLCVDFLASCEWKPDTKFGCYLISGKDPYSQLGRYIESEVFNETFKNSPEIMAREYGPYEPVSLFFVIIDQETEMPVGVMRIIKNSEAGLKSLVDLKDTPLALMEKDIYAKFGINPDRCADIATIAILPNYRGAQENYLPSTLLYRSFYLGILNNLQFDHVVTVIDKKAEHNLNILKFPFRTLDERYFSYLDSPESHALYGVNKEFYPTVMQWQKKYAEEASLNGSEIKALLAAMQDAVANGTGIDEMIEPELAKKI